jgi:hypothetical protein
MTYIALDDRFPRDDRVCRLSDRAFRLHVAALCACGEDLTDGVISTPRLRALLALTKATTRQVNKLVAEGLWRHVITGETFTVEGRDGSVGVVANADGYWLCDFLTFNRSRARVEAIREARREAGSQGGLAKARASASPPVSENGLHSDANSDLTRTLTRPLTKENAQAQSQKGLAKPYPETETEFLHKPLPSAPLPYVEGTRPLLGDDGYAAHPLELHTNGTMPARFAQDLLRTHEFARAIQERIARATGVSA